MAKKITHEEFKEKVFNLVGDEYEVLSEYVNNQTKIMMRHTTCGNEYPVAPAKFTSSGNRCPECSKKRGRGR